MSLFSLPQNEKRRNLAIGVIIFALVTLVALGAMAKNGWLPATDPLTGKRTGWFGSTVEVASVPVNPTSTPQLSKELIYAGDRLLTVEDANATAVPPADLAVWRPSSGVWYVMAPGGGLQTAFQWGTNGDRPVAGDYDGDGKTDFSVFRPDSGANSGTWYIFTSSTNAIWGIPFGLDDDIPAMADYDGDGKTDIAVVRPGGTPGYTSWYILRSSDSTFYPVDFGIVSDKPAPADYDGDGRADLGVWRAADKTFHMQRSSAGYGAQPLTEATGNTPVCFDYDGDGRADYGIYNSQTGNWQIKHSTNGQVISHQFGTAGDKEVPNDYDGDGKVDVAVWRNSNG